MEGKRTLLLGAVVVALLMVGLVIMGQSMAASPSGEVPAPGVEPRGIGASGAASSWASGWVMVNTGTCREFQHNLGGNPDDYAVEAWFLDTDAGGLGLHRRGYGGLDNNNQRMGAHWEQLTANDITVCRGADDPWVDLVSIRVWEPAGGPDYDSDWTDISPDQTITFTHGLATAEAQLTVSLWFSSTTRGIHHLGYGGLALDALQELRGAHWHHMTANTVSVSRHQHDTDVEQTRVIVVRGDPPAYDSGWQTISLGHNPLNHNLHWDPTKLLVRAECRWSWMGIHHLSAGGNHHWIYGWQGANVQNLSANTLDLFRHLDDQVCPEARVRIWRRAFLIHLPIVLRNH